MNELTPCPFCGSQSLVFNKNENASIGTIKCSCGVCMSFGPTEEKFVQIGEDIYRKIPRKSGIDIVREHWNRRTGTTHGEWEHIFTHSNGERRYACSNCNALSDGMYNYCPHCGADMREVDHADT